MWRCGGRVASGVAGSLRVARTAAPSAEEQRFNRGLSAVKLSTLERVEALFIASELETRSSKMLMSLQKGQLSKAIRNGVKKEADLFADAARLLRKSIEE